METTTLQVPLSKTLKTSATVVAKEYGFSSLQEIIRILLTKLARRQLVVQIEEAATPLSSKAEKRYLKIEEDFEKRRNVYRAKNLGELMDQLKRGQSKRPPTFRGKK